MMGGGAWLFQLAVPDLQCMLACPPLQVLEQESGSSGWTVTVVGGGRRGKQVGRAAWCRPLRQCSHGDDVDDVVCVLTLGCCSIHMACTH